jgi:cobalt-zinc-cadmium efflux system protein
MSDHGHKQFDADREVHGNRLLAATALNFVIAIAEIVGGLISNSLSLISDALHNLSDALAVLIAWIAHKISKRPSNQKRTFGYKRIEILAALLNAIVLAAISIFLFYEAYLRLLEPQPVKGLIMLVVASIGLLANFLAVILLHSDAKKNINFKAAYLHLLGDTLSSVGVIIGAILIYFFEIYWVDPVVTILIGLYILKETFGILKQANDILMQGTPTGLDLERIRKDLETIPEIANIHHVHIWNLDDQSIHFECHVDLKKDMKLSDTESVYRAMESLLKEKHHISHLTIQFEHHWCDDKNMIHN